LPLSSQHTAPISRGTIPPFHFVPFLAAYCPNFTRHTPPHLGLHHRSILHIVSWSIILTFLTAYRPIAPSQHTAPNFTRHTAPPSWSTSSQHTAHCLTVNYLDLPHGIPPPPHRSILLSFHSAYRPPISSPFNPQHTARHLGPRCKCHRQTCLKRRIKHDLYVTYRSPTTSLHTADTPAILPPLFSSNLLTLHLGSSSQRNSLISAPILVLTTNPPAVVSFPGTEIGLSSEDARLPSAVPGLLVQGTCIGTLRTPHASLPTILMLTNEF
jgi:hypothetical protein